MRKIEPSRSSKQSACEHNPAGSPQVIQSPPYQTPDDDSANNVAEDGDAGVVTAVTSDGRITGRSGGFGGVVARSSLGVVALRHPWCPSRSGGWIWGRYRSADELC